VSAESDFRARVRAWLAANVPRREDEEADDPDPVTGARAIQRKLFDAGLAGLGWPVEYGGQGLDASFQRIFDEEAVGYAVPGGMFNVTFGICLPTVLAHGTEAQKQQYIPAALRGDALWVQFLSEPGAGSDLAGVQMSAVRDGDTWVLNGSKVWSSGAHYCDYALCLARTDPGLPKHQGLTMFIVDLRTPGITIQPLKMITGGSEFNQEFFDDVVVPADRVVGEVNGGWRATLTLLTYERGGGGGAISGYAYSAPPTSSAPTDLIELARARGRADDAHVRQLIGEIYVATTVGAQLSRHTADAIRSGRLPGAAGSMVKLNQAVLEERKAQVALEIAGPAGVVWSASDDHDGAQLALDFLASRVLALGGGTNEIQRNIIGERVLGLTKEPEVDRTIPFRDIGRSR
jgi:alkylation response protein AidB-like acyl-CoA dehydrogenase